MCVWLIPLYNNKDGGNDKHNTNTEIVKIFRSYSSSYRCSCPSFRCFRCVLPVEVGSENAKCCALFLFYGRNKKVRGKMTIVWHRIYFAKKRWTQSRVKLHFFHTYIHTHNHNQNGINRKKQRQQRNERKWREREKKNLRLPNRWDEINTLCLLWCRALFPFRKKICFTVFLLSPNI